MTIIKLLLFNFLGHCWRVFRIKIRIKAQLTFLLHKHFVNISDNSYFLRVHSKNCFANACSIKFANKIRKSILHWHILLYFIYAANCLNKKIDTNLCCCGFNDEFRLFKYTVCVSFGSSNELFDTFFE